MSTYTLGGEAQIVDRVNKYQTFPDEQLRAIISQYGGEMGEAARRVLESRGAATSSPITIPTGSVAVKLPQVLTPQVQVSAPALDMKNPLVLGGIAAAAVVLALVMGKR